MGLQIPCPGGLCPACWHQMKNSELPGRLPFLRSALRADFVMGEERYCSEAAEIPRATSPLGTWEINTSCRWGRAASGFH